MMTMKEACNYKVQSRRQRNREHRLTILSKHGADGFITGFTPHEEKKSIKESLQNGKGASSKGRKAAYNKVWRHNDLPRVINN